MQESALKRAIEVYCDFDGTITDRDSFDFLLAKLGRPGWQEIEDQWERDEITARQCMRLQTELIDGSWTEITKVLEDVTIDPTFAPFARWCRQSGVKLFVVSDGVDRIIKHLLEREGIQVDNIWSNRLVQDTGGFKLEFPNASEDCSLGICKCALLERAGADILRVVIGDSKSDFCWAKVADLLFAKKKLIDYCRREKIAHTEFENFQSIQKVLGEKLTFTAA